MENNFEKDKQKFINKIWGLIPKWAKNLFIILIIAAIPVFKYFNSNNKGSPAVQSTNQSGGITGNNNAVFYQTNYKADDVPPGQTRDIARGFYSEVLGNVNTLEAILKNKASNDFDINKYKFDCTNYDKFYPVSTFDQGLKDQIANFYPNLKRITLGFSSDDILSIKAQGDDIIKRLENTYGFENYYKHATNINTVSGVTVTFVGDKNVASGVVVVEKNSNKNK